MGQISLGVQAPKDSLPLRQETLEFIQCAESPDICFRFHPHPIPLPTKDGKNLGEIHQISHLLRCHNGSWDSPFLALDDVQKRLHGATNFADHISLELLPNQLSILDFHHLTLDVYHPSDISSGTLFAYLGEYMIAPFLIPFDAVILHSASVVRHKRAAVFLGHDGAGKTTVAHSAKDAEILCDDQVILRRLGGQFTAFGTFWGRTFQAQGQAPVGGLFFIEQSDRFSLTPLSPLAVMKYLWTEYPYTHHPLPLRYCSRAFNLLMDLCLHVPAYLMKFGLRDIDWAAIDAALSIKQTQP